MLKKIVVLVATVFLVMTNICVAYSKDVEMSAEVAVGETVQLKIPAGASDIEWSTSSKRVATISKRGEVSGVKIGECEIYCKAIYPKFVFFKDVVNYTFKLKVVKTRVSANANKQNGKDRDEYRVGFVLYLDKFVNDINEYKPQMVKKGEKAREPLSPITDVAKFIGWYSDPDGNSKFNFNTPIDEDVILYANWQVDDKDSDGDGLIDVSEKENYKTDPYLKDTDGDGLSDYDEVMIGTNPLKKSTQDNGISDYDWDIDEDELSNGKEIEIGTEPNNFDTDGDTLTDGEEVNKYKTDPLKYDTDGDGASDGWEIENGFNPLEYNASFEVTKSYAKPSVDLPVTASVKINSNGENVESLSIKEIYAADNHLVTKGLPGYMGCAYDFSVTGSINNATIEFEYDTSVFGNLNEEFQPRIYYLNEATTEYEELPNQKVENGKVSVEVSHFSTYILLNKMEYDKAWEVEIKPPMYKSNGMTGLNIVMTIDSSGSMTSNDANDLRKTVVKKFLDNLGKNNKAAIVDFDGSAKILQSLTENLNDLKNAVNKVDSSGGTSLSAGISESINQLKNSGSDRYKTIVFLTDGDGSYDDKYTVEAKDNGIVIYTIGLGSGVNEQVLRQIAEGTGGKYYFASVADQLPDIYGDVVVDTIDYTTDSNNDGISDYYTKIIYEGNMPGLNGKYAGIDISQNDDYDGDGLKNGEELIITSKTLTTGEITASAKEEYGNMLLADSDLDGYNDYEEKQNGTDPFIYNSDKNAVDGIYNEEAPLILGEGTIAANFIYFIFGGGDVEGFYRQALLDYVYEYGEKTRAERIRKQSTSTFLNKLDDFFEMKEKADDSVMVVNDVLNMINGEYKTIDDFFDASVKLSKIPGLKNNKLLLGIENIQGKDYVKGIINVTANSISEINTLEQFMDYSYMFNDFEYILDDLYAVYCNGGNPKNQVGAFAPVVIQLRGLLKKEFALWQQEVGILIKNGVGEGLKKLAPCVERGEKIVKYITGLTNFMDGHFDAGVNKLSKCVYSSAYNYIAKALNVDFKKKKYNVDGSYYELSDDDINHFISLILDESQAKILQHMYATDYIEGKSKEELEYTIEDDIVNDVYPRKILSFMESINKNYKEYLTELVTHRN